jgi:hypothetical protein
MIWMVWILVCACQPTQSAKWSDERIVSRVMAALDTNADGQLQAEELQDKYSEEYKFNLNKNESISHHALLNIIQSILPSTFLIQSKQRTETTQTEKPAIQPKTGTNNRLELIRFLALEVAQFAPESPGPEDALMISLATQGGAPFSQEVARLKGLLSPP